MENSTNMQVYVWNANEDFNKENQISVLSYVKLIEKVYKT